jgi:hypothetical protein
LIAVIVIGADRLWCYGANAVEWDKACAHHLLPEQPPVFEIAVVVLALWRARRRSRQLDRPWDWIEWVGEGFQ